MAFESELLNRKSGLPNKTVLLLPLFGMVFFAFLYFIAALRYPGGSWIEPNQNGFSFWHNYLCDLLDYNAINGTLNVGRYFARAALAVLCGGILFLWYHLPRLFSGQSINQSVMRLSGVLSLGTTFFLSAGTHDITVRIAGFFGVVAFVSCSIELYKARYLKLFLFGLVCQFIFLVNYYIYETGAYIQTLPVIQKITFACFILWFVFLDVTLYKKIRPRRNKEVHRA